MKIKITLDIEIEGTCANPEQVVRSVMLDKIPGAFLSEDYDGSEDFALLVKEIEIQAMKEGNPDRDEEWKSARDAYSGERED